MGPRAAEGGLRLVVDANQVISALLRDGATRQAILKTPALLFAPEELLSELQLHLPDLARRVGVSASDLSIVLGALMGRFHWVPKEDYREFLKQARDAIGRVDPKDVAYLACALAVGADAIWSRDRDFDEQKLVPRVDQPDEVGP